MGTEQWLVVYTKAGGRVCKWLQARKGGRLMDTYVVEGNLVRAGLGINRTSCGEGSSCSTVLGF